MELTRKTFANHAEVIKETLSELQAEKYRLKTKQTSAKLHFLISELNQLLIEWHAGLCENEFLRRLGSRVWMEIGEKQRPPYLMEIEALLRKQIADFGVIVFTPTRFEYEQARRNTSIECSTKFCSVLSVFAHLESLALPALPDLRQSRS